MKRPLKDSLLNPEDLDLLYLTRNCNEAFTVIKESFKDYQDGGERFCHAYYQ